jgi:hypothetical protein
MNDLISVFIVTVCRLPVKGMSENPDMPVGSDWPVLRRQVNLKTTDLWKSWPRMMSLSYG